MVLALLERDIESLIYSYPWLLDDKYVTAGLKGNMGNGRQVNVGRQGLNRYIDLLFKDTRDNRPVIVELKKTVLERANIAQILEYRALLASMDDDSRANWIEEFGVNYFAPKMILVGEAASEEVLISANLAGIDVRILKETANAHVNLNSVQDIHSKLQEWDAFLHSGNRTVTERSEWVEDILIQVQNAVGSYEDKKITTIKKLSKTTDSTSYITGMNYPFINIPIRYEGENFLGLYEYYDEQFPFSEKYIYCDFWPGALSVADSEGDYQSDNPTGKNMPKYLTEQGYIVHDVADGCLTIKIPRNVLQTSKFESFLRKLIHDAVSPLDPKE